MTSHDDGELNRIVGEISGKLDGLQRDNERLFKENRVLFHGLDDVRNRLAKVEEKMEPVLGTVSSHAVRLLKLEAFDGKIAAVVMIISVTAGASIAGVWQIIVNFSAVISFARRLFGGGP